MLHSGPVLIPTEDERCRLIVPGRVQRAASATCSVQSSGGRASSSTDGEPGPGVSDDNDLKHHHSLHSRASTRQAPSVPARVPGRPPHYYFFCLRIRLQEENPDTPLFQLE